MGTKTREFTSLPDLHPNSLSRKTTRFYRSTWEWSGELIAELPKRHAFELPAALLNEMDRHPAHINS